MKRNYLKKISLITMFLFIHVLFYGQTKIHNVNPNSSVEAVNLLNFLYEIKGKYILAGQHNYISTESTQTERAKAFTGKYPIVWGSDFSFCYEGDSPKDFQHCGPLNITMPGDSCYITNLKPAAARQRLVNNAIKLNKEGFIITLMWHACPPGLEDCCNGNRIWTFGKENHLTQQQMDELTTDDTPLNESWKRQTDTIAFYLKQLCDAKVPVLWRPYHENNGVWFWWCNHPGDKGFKKLWIMMYKRFVDYHKLNNLIWVWNTNAPRDKKGDEAGPYENYYPGVDYVDIFATDVYRKDWKQSHHDDLLKLANGKPIALGEVGDIPTGDILKNQKEWVWFMPWFSWMYNDPKPGMEISKNGEDLKKRSEDIRRTYSLPQLITKDEVIKNKNGELDIKPVN